MIRSAVLLLWLSRASSFGCGGRRLRHNFRQMPAHKFAILMESCPLCIQPLAELLMCRGKEYYGSCDNMCGCRFWRKAADKLPGSLRRLSLVCMFGDVSAAQILGSNFFLPPLRLAAAHLLAWQSPGRVRNLSSGTLTSIQEP
jgi:hypothetical protein